MTIENELRHVHAEGRMGRTPDFAAIAANITALSARASAGEGGRLPAQATVKESLTVPPAHGDGDGVLQAAFAQIVALVPPQKREHARWIADQATTRPTPEAQPPHVGEVIAEMRQEQDRAHLGRFGHRVRDWADRLSTHPTPEAQEARDVRPTMRELIDVLPGVYYMDPPDGGSVSLLEQLQRMAQDAARYRWLADGLSELADNPRDVLINAVWMESPSEMDAAIDAALALPAQGEGS